MLVALRDDVHIDCSTTTNAIVDASANGLSALGLYHVALIGAHVSGSSHDNASRTCECLQCLALEYALAGNGDALATAKVDNTWLALTLCTIEDVLETKHSNCRAGVKCVFKLLTHRVEINGIDVGLGGHTLILAFNGSTSHDAHHMGAMNALVGVLRVCIVHYFLLCFKSMTEAAIFVGPVEIIVVLHSSIAFFIKKRWMSEVET